MACQHRCLVALPPSPALHLNERRMRTSVRSMPHSSLSFYSVREGNGASGLRRPNAAMERPQSTSIEAKEPHEEPFARRMSGLTALAAAALVWSATCQQGVAATEVFERPTGGACEIASLADATSAPEMVQLAPAEGTTMMMSGMTAQGFNPERYAGRWYEVASLKKGFAGQGQEDCHCTQGIYSFDSASRAIQVDTFCVHGSPSGYVTGIRGSVSCVPDAELDKVETEFEREEMIREKCFLRFPSIPFIPKLPYDVIATDYDNFALVSGAKDTSFIQIYSRTPTPGAAFIEENKEKLRALGYDANSITDTPQDCPTVSMDALGKMMSAPGAGDAMNNRLPVAMSDLAAAIELPKGSNIVTESLKRASKLFIELFQ